MKESLARRANKVEKGNISFTQCIDYKSVFNKLNKKYCVEQENYTTHFTFTVDLCLA